MSLMTLRVSSFASLDSHIRMVWLSGESNSILQMNVFSFSCFTKKSLFLAPTNERNKEKKTYPFPPLLPSPRSRPGSRPPAWAAGRRRPRSPGSSGLETRMLAVLRRAARPGGGGGGGSQVVDFLSLRIIAIAGSAGLVIFIISSSHHHRFYIFTFDHWYSLEESKLLRWFPVTHAHTLRQIQLYTHVATIAYIQVHTHTHRRTNKH